jgi:hypothetical protein
MKRRASAPRLDPDRLGNQATPPVAYSETYKCSGPSRHRDEIAGANTHWLGGCGSRGSVCTSDWNLRLGNSVRVLLTA